MVLNLLSERKFYWGKFGQDFMINVIDFMGLVILLCMCEVMGVFIQYIYDFVREINFIVDEWMVVVQMINWVGQMSNNKCNEGQFMCDIIGLELWVFFLLQV